MESMLCLSPLSCSISFCSALCRHAKLLLALLEQSAKADPMHESVLEARQGLLWCKRWTAACLMQCTCRVLSAWDRHTSGAAVEQIHSHEMLVNRPAASQEESLLDGPNQGDFLWCSRSCPLTVAQVGRPRRRQLMRKQLTHVTISNWTRTGTPYRASAARLGGTSGP